MPVMAPAMALLGLGIHMLQNMLQTSATQMTPGCAAWPFQSSPKCCSSARLAVRRSGGIGFAPVFMALGVALSVLGAMFAQMLDRRPPRSEPVEASP
jgi:hypothetical protein